MTLRFLTAIVIACVMRPMQLQGQSLHTLTQAELKRLASAADAIVVNSMLDVLFPPLELKSLGCFYGQPLLDDGPSRRYVWSVVSRFVISAPGDDHFMRILVSFDLPKEVELTPARLDSALATLLIDVEENVAEPLRTTRRIAPTRASATLDSGRLKVHLEGEQAVQAFLSARSDSLSLGWCQRGGARPNITIPIERR
jgi:hypothetical protein